MQSAGETWWVKQPLFWGSQRLVCANRYSFWNSAGHSANTRLVLGTVCQGSRRHWSLHSRLQSKYGQNIFLNSTVWSPEWSVVQSAAEVGPLNSKDLGVRGSPPRAPGQTSPCLHCSSGVPLQFLQCHAAGFLLHALMRMLCSQDTLPRLFLSWHHSVLLSYLWPCHLSLVMGSSSWAYISTFPGSVPQPFSL